VDRALAGYLEDAVPLRGVVHAAGVLDDGILLQLDAGRFRSVMLPKVAGTWNLHRATETSALDFFVCFSSAAPVLGSRGQGNYAAANAFMDALMQYRRQRGLPALSVNWGPWAEVGMAADLDDVATRRMFDQGWSPIPTTTAMESLAALMCSDTAQAAVLPLRWASFLSQYPADAVPAFFEDVAEPGPREGGAVGATDRDDVLAKLSGGNQEERRDLLVDYLRSRLAATLGMEDPSSIDLDLSFAELGIDSLLQMELRGTLASALGLDIPLAEFIDSSTVSDLTDLVLKHLALSAIAATDDGGDAIEEMEELVL
jgi:acyl carrier protein